MLLSMLDTMSGQSSFGLYANSGVYRMSPLLDACTTRLLGLSVAQSPLDP